MTSPPLPFFTLSRLLLFFDPVSEIIDPVFVKASPICSFSMTENDCFGLVFTKTGSINSGTGSEIRDRDKLRNTGSINPGTGSEIRVRDKLRNMLPVMFFLVIEVTI
jgi:hypothetical protein